MAQDNRLLPPLPVERGLDRPLSDLAAPKSYGASMTEPTHLREYVAVVLKRKWLILSLVLVVTTLVTIQMYRSPSIYEAATTIQIEPKQANILARNSAGGVVINTGSRIDPTYINTQLRLLENPTLARQVILSLDLQHNPAFFGGESQTTLYSSIQRIFSGDRRQSPDQADPNNSAVPTFKTDEVTDQALSQEELAKLEPYEDALAGGLTVEPVVGTSLVTLHYHHTNPELARDIVNQLANTFIYNSLDVEDRTTLQNKKLLSDHISDLQNKIHSEQERLVNFQIANNLPVEGSPAVNLPAQREQMLGSQLLDAENKLKDLQAQYDAAAAAEKDPMNIPAVQSSQRVQDLRKKIEDLETKRDEMLQVYTREWPGVKKLDAQIEPLQTALRKAPTEIIAGIKQSRDQAAAHVESLRREFNKQSGETRGMNAAQVQVSAMKQELETDKQEYQSLLQKSRDLDNSTAGGGQNNITVTNYARLPHEPVGPARGRMIVLAFLLSLGVGVGLAFLLDYLDDTLKTVDDVDRYLHLPSLALIPASRSGRARITGRRAALPAAGETGAAATAALALTSDVRSPSAEAYRHLRTSLLLSSAGQPPKTILVTSSQPSEGKTTTAVNTAITLAQTGAPVLIVDCDLRRPRIHANFQVSNARGLTNYLSGERDLDALVKTYDKLPNLKILTSGPVPPNPAELLGSMEMRRLLAALGERFAHIVIDSPPCISFTDASILSTLVDGVMLVVHSGRSSRAVVRRAKQQLVDVGANVFGVVLNNVRFDSPEYYYSGYYYSNYYSNYYGQQDDEGEAEETEAAEETVGSGAA